MTVEAGVAPRAAGRRSIGDPVRIGLWIVGIDVLVHTVGGNFANDWEGWGVALGSMAFALVAGVIAVALVFGVLVRIGMKRSSRGNRPAKASLFAGVLGIASYVVFFTGLPAVVGAGAVTLGIEGLARAREGEGGRGPAVAGLALSILNIGFTAVFYTSAIVEGVAEHWI